MKSILLCFIDTNQQPRLEGAGVGRLLAGYGELELEICQCVAAAGNNDLDAAIKAIFIIRSAERRIKRAKQMVGSAYRSLGLGMQWAEAISDMDWCREIRNLFAHCHWYDYGPTGLRLFDLETLAKRTSKIGLIESEVVSVDLALLERQEAFFKYVQQCFWSLSSSYQRLSGRTPRFEWQRPRMMARPPKHN
jgi:hypothetical protein